MISLLIRCSYRPVGFQKTLDSILSQNFTGYRIICSYDDERALSYIPESFQKIRVHKTGRKFFYDDYCSELKALVNDGYFAFVDEGDTVIPGALRALWKHLKGSKGVICQFSRGGHIKPKKELIDGRRVMRGKIGMPCLFLRHDFKDVAHFDGSVGAADYHWIKAVSKKVRLRFVPLVVVYAEKRDGGATESHS